MWTHEEKLEKIIMKSWEKKLNFKSEGNTNFIESSVYGVQGGMDEEMAMVLIIVKNGLIKPFSALDKFEGWN